MADALRKFHPLKPDHWLVTEATPCAICGRPFQAGDETTLIATTPASPEDFEKARAGRAYTSEAAPVHWDCAPK